MIVLQIRFNNDYYTATLPDEEKAKQWIIDMTGAILDKYGLPEYSSIFQVIRVS